MKATFLAHHALKILEMPTPPASKVLAVETTKEIVEKTAEERAEEAILVLVEDLAKKKPNKRSAEIVIAKLKKEGYDVEDAQGALDEYNDTIRSDFEDADEFADARLDAYDVFLESLREAAGNPPELPEVLAKPLLLHTPAGRVLDELMGTDAIKDNQVNLNLLGQHPDVKAGRVTNKQLLAEIKKRGLSVDTIEMHAGYYPIEIRKAWVALRKARNTRPTFLPIQELTAMNSSIPKRYLNLLSKKHLVVLKSIDQAAATENHHISRILLEHNTVPQLLPPAARDQYNKHVLALTRLHIQRESLREPVEIILGDVKKRKYSQLLASKIDQASLMPEGSLPAYSDGSLVGYWWKPRGEQRLEFYRPTPEATKLDESIWKNPPGMYTRYLGLVRDVFGETLVRPLRNASRQVQAFESSYQNELYKALKPIIKNVESMERVTLMLEGKVPANLTAAEKQAFTGLREWYTTLFKEFGIESERFLQDYAPRIRQYGSIRKAFGTDIPKDLQFFAELERTAKDIVFPTELNSLLAAIGYLRLGARKKFLQPALNYTSQFVRHMHQDRQFMWREFENAILQRPLWEERLLNGVTNSFLQAVMDEVPQSLQRRYARELSALVLHAGYLGTLGGNLMSALKNLTQIALAVFTLSKNGNPGEGLRYMVKAFRALRTKEGQQALKMCDVLHQRVFLEGLDAQIGLMGLNKFLKPVSKAGMYFFEEADKLNVKVSYLMKLLYDLDHGKALAETVDAANTFAANTQFLYGIDSPMLFKTPLGRVLGMFYSWPLNYIRLLQKQGIEQGITPVLVNVAGMTAVTWLNTRVTGLNFSVDSPIGGVLPSWFPVSYMVSGETSLPVETVLSAANLFRATLSDALHGTSTTRDKAWGDMKQSLYSYIPFYTAGRRVGTVAQAWGDLAVRDEEGKIKYRYGEIVVPGGEVKQAPWPGRVIPEQYRALVGPAVEQTMRRATHERISKTEKELAKLRKNVIKAYLAGDKATVQREQARIKALGGRPVTKRSLMQTLQAKEKPALERHAEGLYQGQPLTPSQREAVLRSLLGQPI
ncbi:MAG: hypothetical protein DDT33_01272 [Firmicutes bacterium]|nr:hypothetical protein [Bacillota bacterium]